jgi:hypothetical protein
MLPLSRHQIFFRRRRGIGVAVHFFLSLFLFPSSPLESEHSFFVLRRIRNDIWVVVLLHVLRIISNCGQDKRKSDWTGERKSDRTGERKRAGQEKELGLDKFMA